MNIESFNYETVRAAVLAIIDMQSRLKEAEAALRVVQRCHDGCDEMEALSKAQDAAEDYFKRYPE